MTDLSINGQFPSKYQGVQLQTQASCCPYLSIGDTFTIGATTYVIIQIKAGTIVAVDGAKNMSIETLLDPNRVTSAVALQRAVQPAERLGEPRQRRRALADLEAADGSDDASPELRTEQIVLTAASSCKTASRGAALRRRRMPKSRT